MMSDYKIEFLTAGAILEAFTLVRLTAPEVDLHDWKRQARAAIGRRRNRSQGILIARHRLREHICGMVWYRTMVDPVFGRIFEANNVIAVNILDTRAVMLELLAALGPLALVQGCRKIRVVILESMNFSSGLTSAVRDMKPDCVIEHCLNVSFAS